VHKPVIYTHRNPPANAGLDDLWMDRINANFRRWDGSQWVRITLTPAEIDDVLAAARTYLGLYDQLTDTPVLPLANTVNIGAYYIVSETGAFITSIAELNGQQGIVQDWIISNGTVWEILSQGDTLQAAFISKTDTDSAQGKITFDLAPIISLDAVAVDEAVRKSQLDAVFPHNHVETEITDLDKYTQAQVDAALALKSDTTHNHDLIYHLQADVESRDTTTLNTATAYTDSELVNHVANADPHPQYALETAALDIFTTAGYGGIRRDPPIGMGNIGAGWQVVPFNTASLTTPKRVTQDIGNNALRFLNEGVVQVSVSLSVEHNSSNGGRQFSIRLTNLDSGISGNGYIVFVGRNAEGTNIGITLIAEVALSDINQRYVIEIGGSPDTFSSVVLDAGILTATYVSEFRGTL